MKPKPERAEPPAPIPVQLPVFEHKGQLVADSRDVAPFVEKDHAHLLRDIRRYVKVMERANESNFGLVESASKYLTESKVGFSGTVSKHLNDNKFVVADYFIEATYIDPTGRELPNFYCTEMGCEMVANKMTGDKGIIFTAQYVKAFHAMRSLLLERASPIWQDTRSLGKEIRRRETDVIKRLVDYATAQGSRNAARYYNTLSRLADRTAGITERDKAQVVQLTALLLVENTIAQEIAAGIEAGQPCKAVYRAVKNRLAAVQAVGILAGEEAEAK